MMNGSIVIIVAIFMLLVENIWIRFSMRVSTLKRICVPFLLLVVGLVLSIVLSYEEIKTSLVMASCIGVVCVLTMRYPVRSSDVDREFKKERRCQISIIEDGISSFSFVFFVFQIIQTMMMFI